MDMPQIEKCDAQECSYNKDGQCHALAVTIGDKRSHPMCDTFTMMAQDAGDTSTVGRVGACRSADCEYNTSLECQAPAIDVGAHKKRDWDCKTFEKRGQSTGREKQGW